MSEPSYLTAEIDVLENSPEQLRNAALTVARFASTQGDPKGVAGDLLDMLGLTPEPSGDGPSAAPARQQIRHTGRCRKCGHSTYYRGRQKPFPGAKVSGSRGLCAACYRTVLRAEKKADAQ